MSDKNLGNMGYGIVGGLPPEGRLLRYRVDGCYVIPPATASAQLTGTGNGTYRVDITPGLIHIDGKVKQVDPTAQAVSLENQLLETAGNILANGESKVYAVIAWLHPVTGAITIKMVAGTKATTGSQVAPTVAEIEAGLHVDASWVHLANVTVNRTGDTTVTQTQDNTVRPRLYPVQA